MSDPEDVARFTALYDAHRPRVHAYVVSRVGAQAAEEITSEAFCVAWRRIRDMPDDPLPWLFGIARNLLLETYRRRSRENDLERELRAWAAGQRPASDVADAVAERAGMLRALAGLPDGDRELLTLVAWHELSPAQAARVLGCSKAAFYARLHRARRRLERAVAAQARTPGPGPAPAPSSRGPSLIAPRKKAVR